MNFDSARPGLRRPLLVFGATLGVALSPRPVLGQALTLRDVLDSVRAHPSIRAAESRVRASEGARVTAGTLGNPTLSYQVDQTLFPGGRALVGLEREAMTTATLPLEFLYQRAPRVARANADVRTAAAEAAAARQRVGIDAATAYYRVALAQIQGETTRDLQRWLDTLVAYNQSRVNEGVAAEADLIRSRLERDRIAAESAMQEAELAGARATLATFVSDGRITRDLPVVAAGGAPLPLPPFATIVRPDVLAARERVVASTAAVSSEHSMFVRQLGATIGTMQTAGTTSMIAGVSLPLPAFDQNRGEIQRASAQRDAAEFELAAQERSASADLRGAAEAARILTERATALARNDSSGFLSLADESRRIALGAYREGAVPLYQVIDAVRSWADARMTYYQTLFAQHQSVLALVVAQGRDLFTSLPAGLSGTSPR